MQGALMVIFSLATVLFCHRYHIPHNCLKLLEIACVTQLHVCVVALLESGSRTEVLDNLNVENLRHPPPLFAEMRLGGPCRRSTGKVGAV